MTQTVIKHFVVRNRHFEIVKDEQGFYLAIESKYITNGRLNTTLNGFQMYASKELNGCLNTCKNQVEIEYLVDNGYSKAQAFGKVFNIPVTPELETALA